MLYSKVKQIPHKIYFHVILLQDTNPSSRWTPKQAMQHPFIRDEPMKGIWYPTPDDLIRLPPDYTRRFDVPPPPSALPHTPPASQSVSNLPLAQQEYVSSLFLNSFPFPSLPFLSFPFLYFPFLCFPFLSFPFLSLPHSGPLLPFRAMWNLLLFLEASGPA